MAPKHYLFISPTKLETFFIDYQKNSCTIIV